MGDWCDILNRTHPQAQCAQRSDCRFTPDAWTFYKNVYFNQSVLLCPVRSRFRCHLSRIGCGLLRPFETQTSCRSPRQCVAHPVGDGDDGVIEGRLNVHVAFCNILFLISLRFAHFSFPLISLFSFRQRSFVCLFESGRWSGFSVLVRVGLSCAAVPDRNQYPSSA